MRACSAKFTRLTRFVIITDLSRKAQQVNTQPDGQTCYFTHICNKVRNLNGKKRHILTLNLLSVMVDLLWQSESRWTNKTIEDIADIESRFPDKPTH